MLGLSTNTNQGDIQKCVSPFTFNLKKNMANKDIQNYWIGGIGFALFFIIGICIAPLVTFSIVWLIFILISYIK